MKGRLLAGLSLQPSAFSYINCLLRKSVLKEKMKILLIGPMASRKSPIKGRRAHFPVGLGLIAASLKESGATVKILDNETECLNKCELSDYIEASEYDAYGITAMAPQYRYIKGLSKMIKKAKNRPIILGGPLATYSYEAVLTNTDVDVCVIGEGEETIDDLIENMNDLENVSGIAYKDNESVYKTPARILRMSRDEYSFPAYELFNMEPYFKKLLGQYEGWGSEYLNKNVAGLKIMGIMTGIGCPYHCKFCSRSVIKPRLRSIDNIISEITYCVDKYDIKAVRFNDDLLIINEKRTLELCEKIKPLNLIWSGLSRTNVLNDKLAKAMKDAGCIGVGFGYESGSNVLLKAMNKGLTVEDHKKATVAAKRNGLAIRVQLMFGYPGENMDSVEETISFFKEMEIPPRRFNVLTPLPGSELYDECLENGTITNEDGYLENVSKHDAGFSSKKVLLNLTEMIDDEFEKRLLYAEKTMEDNYKKIFKVRHPLWFLVLDNQLLRRQMLRIRKIANIAVWKTKARSVYNKSRQLKLSRNQIEDLYFNL